MTFTPGQIIRAASDVSFENITTSFPPPPVVVNRVRFFMRITAIDATNANASRIRYGGVEVDPFYDTVNNTVAWSTTPNGRVMSVTGSDDTAWASPLLIIGGIPHQVGSVVPVIEQYDEDGRVTRWIDSHVASDVRVGIITARSGTINATYTVQDIRHTGRVHLNVSPMNRITTPADAINWRAAEVGSAVLLLYRQEPDDMLIGAVVFEAITLADCP
jgi:hypothetical protein